MAKEFVGDSIFNLRAQLGYGANNVTSGTTYGFNPVGRNHVLLEWMYRGSWIVRKIVDCPAEDMTRAGTHVESDMPPDRIDRIGQLWNNRQVWQRLCSAIKWARLYGGAMAVIMIDGQRMETPLRLDTVGRGAFKGLLVLDRWMVQPNFEDVVTDLGADFGLPKFYNTVADARAIPNMKIHHSRCLRIDGYELPYFQRMTENWWGLSVIESLFDRMIAFDSTTQGAAQLVYKAHLRVMKVDGYRDIMASAGKQRDGFLAMMEMVRLMQVNEGLTVIDKDDEFQANTYSFGGLADMMIQFNQQLSGACDVPLTRLFGQSPAGMNSTGDSDLRNYYDAINAQQNARLREGVATIYDVSYRSLFGEELPDGFEFSFNPLWQLSELEKAQVAQTTIAAVDTALQSGVIDAPIAARELRQSSRITGIFSNIDDEYIAELEEQKAMQPPGMGELMGQPGAPGQPQPGQAQGIPPGAPGEAEDAAVDPVTGLAIEPRRETEFEITINPNTPEITVDAMAKSISEGVAPVVDFHGLTIVIETMKGQRRQGYGWSTQMPAHYGYIRGTSSAEGPREQMDCYLGPDLNSEVAWIVEQQDPDSGTFDEHKCMLGYASREDAIRDYHAAFSDGRGPERVGEVRRMTVQALKEWLASAWQYGRRPPLRAVS